MHFDLNKAYHIYNRGNNKQTIFFDDDSYVLFLNKLRKQLSPVCEILCWCLMPNHFHLIVYTTEKSCEERKSFGGKPMQELSYQIGLLLSSYSQITNKRRGSTGSLFQQKTKAKLLTGPEAESSLNHNLHYLICCMHYIHQNPWKAILANRMEDWSYSSFKDYCGFRNGNLCNKNLLMSLTDYDVVTFYENSYGIISVLKTRL